MKIFNYIKKKFKSEIDIYRENGVKIGDGCHFYNAYLDYGHSYLIEIGNNCTLTHCTILSHDASTKMFIKKSKVGIVSIGDNTFIGWGAIILPNVKIGKNCIIGAGSVVSCDIPDGSVVGGNPCKILCKTTDFIEKHKDNMEKCPVFEKKWNKKNKEEKLREKELLHNTIGYDE